MSAQKPARFNPGDVAAALDSFLTRVREKSPACFLLQFTGVRYAELEGQRPLRFANEAARRGIPVLYAYLERGKQQSATLVHPDLLVITLDMLLTFRDTIFAAPLGTSVRPVLCLHFPHAAALPLFPLARRYGWFILYDCMDHWREFHPLGQAHWHSEETEAAIIRASDAVTVTNPTLGQELGRFGLRSFTVIPNGVDPSRLDPGLPPLNLPRGDITAGFFGYFTRAWFDWDRLVRLARWHPRWLFPLIGWGEAIPDRLPPNITFLGTVPHTDLPRYTAGWDVGLVNFKNTLLVRCSCPIKVYEYLHLGLPVVSVDIPHIRAYPSVYTATTPAEFASRISLAANSPVDPQVIVSFLAAHTWEAQFGRLLRLITAKPDSKAVEVP